MGYDTIARKQRELALCGGREPPARLHDDTRGIPDDEWQVIAGETEITRPTHNRSPWLWLVRWVLDPYGGEVRRHRTDDGMTIALRLGRAVADQ